MLLVEQEKALAEARAQKGPDGVFKGQKEDPLKEAVAKAREERGEALAEEDAEGDAAARGPRSSKEAA